MKYWSSLPNKKQEKQKKKTGKTNLMLQLRMLGDYTWHVLKCQDTEISSLVHFIINKLANFPNR